MTFPNDLMLSFFHYEGFLPPGTIQKMSANQEKINQAAEYYSPTGTPDVAVIQLDQWWIEKYVKGPNVLEMGCSDGTATQMLLRKGLSVQVVEGSAKYCEIVKSRIHDPRLSIHQSMFEDYIPKQKFNDIVMARSLDYIENPIALLNLMRTWLLPKGRLHIVVQNAGSLHRRLGVALGKMSALDELTEHSRKMGHRRVYTESKLISDLAAAQFYVEKFKGFLLKPFDFHSLSVIGLDLNKVLIPALFDVGMDVPDELCCQLYVCCSQKN